MDISVEKIWKSSAVSLSRAAATTAFGPLFGRHQWRQIVGSPGLIAAGIVHAIYPGRLKVAAHLGAHFVNRTTNRNPNFAVQRYASRRLAIRTNHGHPMGRNLNRHVRRYPTAQKGVGFSPVKGGPKISTASTTADTGIVHKGVGNSAIELRRFCDTTPILGN
jgi:hypothetical protein